MKRMLAWFVFAFMIGIVAQAQPDRKQFQDKIDAQRTAFITTRLSLTPAEAEKFWPIYNEFRLAMKDVKQEKRPDKRPEDMSDKEADEFLAEALEAEQREFELKKNLVQKLRTVLPSHKIVMLFRAEEAFKKQLLDEMRDRRDGGGGGGKGGNGGHQKRGR